MRLDSLQEVAGSAVVQKEESLATPPQRSGAKLIGPCRPLRNPVAKYTHVVHQQVREQVRCLVP